LEDLLKEADCEDVGKSVLMCEPISERIIVMRLKAAPVNMLIVQIYAPCEDAKEEEKFYEMIDQVITDFKKGRECLVVMGDFNGKVRNSKEEDTVGLFGLGVRKDNGERVVNFSKRHKLFITNTWYQQRRSAQYAWKSEHENVEDQIRNHIDYVLVDKRLRNGMQNIKSMPGADCL
jgi:exonuclease III